MFLEVQHRLQDLLVAPRQETDTAENLQNESLCLEVVCGEALGDDVHAGGMRQDVLAAVLWMGKYVNVRVQLSAQEGPYWN